MSEILRLIDFTWVDAVDILAVALIAFYLYRVLRRSRSLYVFVGIVIFLLIFLLVGQVFDLKLLGKIIGAFANFGVLSLIVIFQEEIRRFFYNLGANKRVRDIINYFHNQEQNKDVEKDKEMVMSVVMACMNMARHKVGALIVIEREQRVDEVVQIGEIVDAKVSARLIENVFFKNSPLHDGAMIISQGRVKAAGCVLPVSHDYDIPKELGLRHRSAMGVSQECDAIAIVVSEETGRIAVAEGGKFHLRLTSEQLEQLISK